MPVPWQLTDKLTPYHGTDEQSAHNLLNPPPSPPTQSPIQLARCQRLTDFGRGFYTTTHLHQAKNWANTRALRLFHHGRRPQATVIRFEVDWTWLDALTRLSFVVEGLLTSQYWDLIRTCRSGHFLGDPPYDVVFGPVSLWPQTLTIKDCDQISFHTDRALKALRSAAFEDQATGTNVLFVVT